MKKFKNFSKNLLKKESGQGATEYILLLVVVVAVVLMFKGQITEKLKDTVSQLSGQIDSVVQQ